MEKYKVDYGEFSHFRGITIDFNYLREGLYYAHEHNIKDVFVRSEENNVKQTVNFDFLKEYNYIETFHWVVSLSKKSDITGLYSLSNLKNLRWGVGTNFDFDLSYFPQLETINIGYGSKIEGWNTLFQLKRLIIGSVKTDDLLFLHDVINLEYLRIVNGSFSSIRGLEGCHRLKTIFIQGCNSLVHVKETIKQAHSVENLLLERCKNADLAGIELLGLKHISIL